MKNFYLQHAKEIKDICVKEKCDVGVACLKFEERIGVKGSKPREEFLSWCNQYTLNKIVETGGTCVEV